MLQSRWTASMVVLVTSLSILVPTIAVGAKTGSTTTQNTSPATRGLIKPVAFDPIKQLKRERERVRARAAKRFETKVRRLQRQWHRKQARLRAERLAHQAAMIAAQSGASSTNTGAGSGTAPHSSLQAIAQCESGGNPGAIGGGGAYRGKYQFDYGTWASVGGSGDPAAASEAEQDMRAAKLYSIAGAAPWPVCGR